MLMPFSVQISDNRHNLFVVSVSDLPHLRAGQHYPMGQTLTITQPRQHKPLLDTFPFFVHFTAKRNIFLSESAHCVIAPLLVVVLPYIHTLPIELLIGQIIYDFEALALQCTE